jgi:glycerophosphoryl diester phosphodiesterase
MKRMPRRPSWMAAVVVSGMVVVLSTHVGRSDGQPAKISSTATAACIRDPQCHRLVVVAHRAEGVGAPENSREAVRRCIEAGVPVVDIDLRRSRDGHLFVIHDGTLQRTTTLQGRIETMPSETLAQARLANGESLPRFEQIYGVARGRAVLVLNFKAEADVVERVADWMAVEGSFDDIIFFVKTGEEIEAAARAKRRHPAMLVMVRLLDVRVTVESTRAVFQGRLPEVFHTDVVGRGEVSRLRSLGAKVYMSSLRAERYIQPLGYLLVGSILGASPDFVQTDEPVSVMRRVGR